LWKTQEIGISVPPTISVFLTEFGIKITYDIFIIPYMIVVGKTNKYMDKSIRRDGSI
jgi:ABC-type uncharacterized transport system permease subunit